MTLEKQLERIAVYASLYAISGKQRHYDLVMENTAEAISLLDKSSVTVLKEHNGKPTVIEWNGERFMHDSGTTFRGGVQRGKAHKT